MSRTGWFAAALLLAFVAPVCGWIWPALNWDMLAYIGIVKCWSLPGLAACHAGAYADVASFAHTHRLDAAFDDLLNGNDYRRALTADPAAFAESFGFYRIRPLYIASIAAIGSMTTTLSAATLVISCASVLAANLAILVFAFRQVRAPWAALLCAAFALSPPIMTVAGLSTPDALVAAIATIATITWLSFSPIWGAALLLLCVAARSDFALTDVAVASVLLLVRWLTGIRVPAVAITLLALSYPLMLAIDFAAGGYSFATIYAHTFTGWLVHPASATISVPLRRVFAAFCYGVAKGLADGALWLPVLPAAALIAMRPRLTPSTLLATAFVAAAFVRVLIFPLVDMRLQAPIFAAAFVCLVGNKERQGLLF